MDLIVDDYLLRYFPFVIHRYSYRSLIRTFSYKTFPK